MKSTHNNKPNFKDFWDNQDDSGHTFNTLEWYEMYSNEMLSYFKSCDSIVDCGCGSGEMLQFTAPKVGSVIAVDYSTKMLEKAKVVINENKIENVGFVHENFLKTNSFLTEPVDVVYNNGVLQYIHFDETLNFLKEVRKYLKPSGQIIFFNVPNIKYLSLYGLRVFHNEGYLNPFRLATKYISLKKDILKEKVKNKSYEYDAGIGYWYSEADFNLLANEAELNIRLYASKFLHYAYRMHAEFTLK